MVDPQAETTMDEPPKPRNTESRSLQSILGQQLPVSSFFESVWQVSCAVFPYREKDHEEDDDELKRNPHKDLVREGWDVLLQLLEESRRQSEHGDDDSCDGVITKPLLFKDQASLSLPSERSVYDENMFAAYLDGCSIVVNHCDRISPWVACLCQDLQLSFPHAYANAYITPPEAQAVPPHADDRDVLVMQVVGQKEWKVYRKVGRFRHRPKVHDLRPAVSPSSLS